MLLAIELSKKCSTVESAFSVGAVLVHDEKVISTGYSRELEGNTHAEEVCFSKVIVPENSTLYTTMEPCSKRLSGKKSCTCLILESKVSRVVFGIHEPKHFVDCTGESILRKNGVEVLHLKDMQDFCWSANKHFLF